MNYTLGAAGARSIGVPPINEPCFPAPLSGVRNVRRAALKVQPQDPIRVLMGPFRSLFLVVLTACASLAPAGNAAAASVIPPGKYVITGSQHIYQWQFDDRPPCYQTGAAPCDWSTGGSGVIIKAGVPASPRGNLLTFPDFQDGFGANWGHYESATEAFSCKSYGPRHLKTSLKFAAAGSGFVRVSVVIPTAYTQPLSTAHTDCKDSQRNPLTPPHAFTSPVKSVASLYTARIELAALKSNRAVKLQWGRSRAVVGKVNGVTISYRGTFSIKRVKGS